MTATLAEYLATEAEHMTVVRDEYHRTKVDHAHLDGCDACTVGADFDRLTGWDFVKGLFLCPPCTFQARRAGVAALGRCGNGHNLTDDNTFARSMAGGRIASACLQCQRDRTRRKNEKKRAAKLAAARG